MMTPSAPYLRSVALLFDCYYKSHLCPLVFSKVQGRCLFVRKSLPYRVNIRSVSYSINIQPNIMQNYWKNM
jgi:hypothetical protein